MVRVGHGSQVSYWRDAADMLAAGDVNTLIFPDAVILAAFIGRPAGGTDETTLSLRRMFST